MAPVRQCHPNGWIAHPADASFASSSLFLASLSGMMMSEFRGYHTQFGAFYVSVLGEGKGTLLILTIRSRSQYQ